MWEMDGDAAWDSTRWREEYREAPILDPQQSGIAPKEFPDARRAGSREVDQQPPSLSSWRANSHTPTSGTNLEQLPSPITSRHPSDAWKDSSRLYGRQQTPSVGSTYGQHDAAHTSRPQLGVSWRGLSSDDFRHPTSDTNRIADGLHSHYNRPSNATYASTSVPSTILSESQAFGTGRRNSTLPHLTGVPRNTTTSLPSFASLQESAGRNDEPDEGPEIAPMSDRLTCDLCSKLRPLIEDIATAVAELDETVQSSCNRNVTRTMDFPKDSPLRAVQWIVDRLRYAKTDLQDAGRRLPPQWYQRSSRTVSPPILKRPFQSIDSDDPFAFKRQRAGSVSETLSYLPPPLQASDVPKAAHDFAHRDNAQRVFSPEQTESHPNSAHLRQQSPSIHSSLRQPPSPSSIAYPPSLGASLTGPGGLSVGSPSTSYHRASSIHTVSTSSAASQHIADLQHQVTLKSLSLQTLQSEYSSLLQKLQRERLKSQAIEKKTNVADQEVNDLTGRNEELSDQVKNLESSLEDCEKRRETERAEMVKEKEQWLRMLEMGGRLHAKNATDRQKLALEKRSLELRLSAMGKEGTSGEQQAKATGSPRNNSPNQPLSSAATVDDLSATNVNLQVLKEHGYAVVAAQRENAMLKSRIDVLRFALDEMRRQTLVMAEKEREVMLHRNKLDETVQQALQEDDTLSRPSPQGGAQKAPVGPSSTAPAPTSAVPRTQRGVMAMSQPSSERGNASFAASLPSAEDMARVGRAVSPGPAELGFEVKTTNATPDELIKALGPVPTQLQGSVPLPAWTPPPLLLKTNPASQHKTREPYGPSTPYPGLESTQWRPYFSSRATVSPPASYDAADGGHKSTSSSPSEHEQTQRQGSSSVQEDVRQQSSRAGYGTVSATSMPPPPRPVALNAQVASWRPS